MALITCVECQNKVSDLAKDCPQCGAPVILSRKTPCFECGNLLEPGIKLCNSCGVDQSLNPTILSSENPDALIQVDEKKENTQKIPDAKREEEKVEPQPKINSTEKKENTQPKSNSTASTTSNIKTTTPVKQKSGCLKIFLIFSIVIILLGVVIFNLLSDQTKREIYEALGIENSGFVRNSLATYINMEEVNSRKNILGTWVVDGMIYNTHEYITITKVDIKFKFSDYDETRTIYKNLRPGRIFKSVFEERFDNHNRAYYEGWEVVDARE